MSPAPKEKPGSGAPSRIPPAEWAIALVGAVLTLGAIAYLTVMAFRGSNRPPDVVVEMIGVEQVSAGWLVRIRATNRGDEAVADVAIEGVARRGGPGEERIELTLDYLPAQSSREGGMYFRVDPRREAVDVRATGYREP